MARVYKRVGGVKIEKLIGQHEDVQQRMDEVAEHVRRRAEGILRAHRADGDAEIEVVQKGALLPDRYIVLADVAGPPLRPGGAAMTIEMGRAPSYGSDGQLIHPGHAPIAPLRRAATIPVEAKANLRGALARQRRAAARRGRAVKRRRRR